MAGIAAMLLAGFVGTAMGLNNTATYMASGVAFVAVSLWVDSRISRRRSAARQSGTDAAVAGPDAGLVLDADASNREG
ncbi:hypothetical protein ACVWYS_003961 [Arthrobacter sp. TE12231]|uniref:DUF1275 domain-containing protein n=1 Tax=Arthrobacter humicola TaxID=409291 RepID=A0ABP5KN90_9MICC